LVEVNWFNYDSNLTDATLLITDRAVNKFDFMDYNFTYHGETLVEQGWTVDDGANVLYDLHLNASEGKHLTSLKYIFEDFTEVESKCYAFWFYLITAESEIISSGCMKTNPHWMNEMRNQLKDKKFKSLFIPGTHDSTSFKYNFEPRKETIVTKYSLTQDDNIFSQLMHGIRYLDIRVGYYRSNDHKFWANHGISRLHPLVDILKQVKDFIDETNEIVILDFQEFPVGFKNDIRIHRELANFLFQNMEHYSADPEMGWETTLEDIWRSDKRVIIAYDHFQILKEFGKTNIWQAVRHRWGNKQTYDELEKFLKQSRINSTKNNFWEARPFAEMAELTPQAIDVITNKFGGLRAMADRVNFNITKLYQGDFGRRANVVAVDFYRSTNIVDIAIAKNKQNIEATQPLH
jgi:hypothetical protein